MLEKIFPGIAAKRAEARYRANAFSNVAKILESTPEFARDEDEGAWTDLSNKEVYSESDLDTLLTQARKLYYTDPGAKCVIENLVAFIVGRNAQIVADDPKAQEYWDSWIDAKENKFDRRLKELVRRLLRDGEFFVRFFRSDKPFEVSSEKDGNRSEKELIGYLTLRFIDPEEIKDNTGTHTFGIETDPDDVEEVLAYHRTFRKGSTEDTEVINAEEIIHGKINADSNEKRGKSFLLGIAKYIKHYSNWLGDRITTNRIRNFFHFIMKPESNLANATLKSSFKDESKTTSGTPSKKLPKPGSALIAKGVDYDFKNLEINASDCKDDGRHIERMICKGTGLMEGVVTGDFSNGNYASSLVAESPMVKAVENHQDLIAEYVEEIFEQVIEYAKRINHLEAGVSSKCSVNFATLVHRDLNTDTTAYQVHKQNRWASDKTISSKLGYDYEDEQIQISQEEEEEYNRDRQRDRDDNEEDEKRPARDRPKPEEED